jgi:hypothetical protein
MNPRPIRSMKKIAVFRHAGFVLGVNHEDDPNAYPVAEEFGSLL